MIHTVYEKEDIRRLVAGCISSRLSVCEHISLGGGQFCIYDLVDFSFSIRSTWRYGFAQLEARLIILRMHRRAKKHALDLRSLIEDDRIRGSHPLKALWNMSRYLRSANVE